MLSPLSINKQKSLYKAHQKKYRNRLGFYFGEGFRLLTAALDSPSIHINEIVLSEKVIDTEQGTYIRRTASKNKIPVYRCSEQQMHKLSSEITPPGIFFTIEKTTASDGNLEERTDRIVVFVEQISDAGNLGAILRSMAWFGIRTLILSPGCVDIYNPKTVRASAGAIFEMIIYPDIELEPAIALFKVRGYSVSAAVPYGGRSVRNLERKENMMIVFGSEAGGLSKSTLKLVDQCITIPRIGHVDSLNLAVAAGIIFYSLSG